MLGLKLDDVSKSGPWIDIGDLVIHQLLNQMLNFPDAIFDCTSMNDICNVIQSLWV